MNKHILIVDDSSIMRKMIRKTLEPVGHVIVGEAKNGLEAVELYKSLKPDMVTMDVTMRGMDGFTAAKEILKFDKDAQILFLSNLNNEKYGEDAYRLGAIGYINKNKSKEILNLCGKSIAKTQK
ncbi:MAG TPA: response regulator [Desulfobacteraceae bacterium]|nr:response regulator [Desulfobacteraceae bacterium]